MAEPKPRSNPQPTRPEPRAIIRFLRLRGWSDPTPYRSKYNAARWADDPHGVLLYLPRTRERYEAERAGKYFGLSDEGCITQEGQK